MQLKNQRFFLRFNKLVFPLFYLLHQGKATIVVDASDETRFHVRVNTSDILVIWEIWRAKIYDDTRLPIEAEHVVLDIGAHIGGFALRAARLAQRGRVIAYEASSKNFALLAANRQLNNTENLHIENKAVTDRRGEIKFFIPDDNGALGSMLQETNGPTEAVQATTLADILDEHNIQRVDYLKLDVEGAEYGILTSCTVETLARVRRIVMEYHEFDGDSRNHRDLVRLLQSHGFHVVVEGGIFPQKMLFGTGIIKAWHD
jgi:FkbM family methyltransferase